jgi:hypothetical protein
MRLKKSLLIILALALLSLGGCSRVTLGYNYADWLLRYWITDYTSFTAAQKDNIHLEVDDYMRWHRRDALPEYTALLQDIHTLVNRDGPLTAVDVVRVRAESNRLYQLTVAPMIPPAARLLATLDSRQIAGLADNFAERNRRQKAELLQGGEQEQLGMRAERHVELTERLVGSLSDEQEEKITAMSLHIPFATRQYIEQREAKQAILIALLNDRAGEAEIATLFRQWTSAPEISRTAQQQQAIAAYESAMNEFTAQIFALLTPAQKQHLSKKLLSYIADFQRLHAAAAPLPD